jgi:hypothetical protein
MAADSACTLEEAAWERLTPGEKTATDTGFRGSAKRGESIRAWFASARLKTGETVVSEKISLPVGVGPVIFKLTGRDAAGHACSGWLVVEP